MITQIFVYFQPKIKLIALDEEIERLCHLVGVLQCVGIIEKAEGQGQTQDNFPATKSVQKKMFKMVVEIHKSKLFDEQYLTYERYG